MNYLVARIAEYLLDHGNCTTTQLAHALGETTSRVRDAIKSERQRAKWGIVCTGYAKSRSGGHASSVWALDVQQYNKYMEQRRDMPWLAKRILKATPVKGVAKSPPSVKVPKEPVMPLTARRAYTGPILTRWQPSSPYYKEKT